MFNFDLYSIVASLPAILIALAFHECAHAYASDFFGDPTPRSQGRVTLNPLAHLDPIGTVFLILAQFGWAKPVMTNPMYYRGNKKRADLIVSIAGVVTNFILAFVFLILAKIIIHYTGGSSYGPILGDILVPIVTYNLFIGLFNLLPVPPLDGFHVLCDLLPDELSYKLRGLEQYGMYILMFLIILGGVSKILMPAFRAIFGTYDSITNAILRALGVY